MSSLVGHVGTQTNRPLLAVHFSGFSRHQFNLQGCQCIEIVPRLRSGNYHKNGGDIFPDVSHRVKPFLLGHTVHQWSRSLIWMPNSCSTHLPLDQFWNVNEAPQPLLRFRPGMAKLKWLGTPHNAYNGSAPSPKLMPRHQLFSALRLVFASMGSIHSSPVW